MNDYEITWSLYIQGDTPTDAALQAKGTLQDPGNTAWVFTALNLDTGQIDTIDIEDTDAPTTYHPS